jgi:Cu2+-exporting ATPase
MCCHGCAALAMVVSARIPREAVIANRHERLAVDRISCANCVKAIESTLERTIGVAAARVDPVSEQIEVSWDDTQASLGTIQGVIERLGYPTALIRDAARLRADGQRAPFKRMLLGWLFMMQVMMVSAPFYYADPGEIAPDVGQLLRIAQILLVLPVVTYCAWPIYRGALRDLRFWQIGMDVPVTLAIGVAFGGSTSAIIQGHGTVYFDSIAMFIALLTTSRWMQRRGLARAGAYLRNLTEHSLPRATKLAESGAATEVRTEDLVAGDCILVRPGEMVGADGRLENGEGLCSESLLTGESYPIQKRIGEAVMAGSVAVDSVMTLRVERVGSDTALAGIQRLASAASRSRPQSLGLAERCVPVFLLIVLAVTLGAGLYWWRIDSSAALQVMIAVLIVTCPCALSMAAPVSIAASQAAMAARGVLVARVGAIETLARSDRVVLDKTGTLTEGKMRLSKIQILRNDVAEDEALRLAASLEQVSNHPIARAIRESCRTPVAVPQNAVSIAGAGAQGELEGRRLRIGTASFAMEGLALEAVHCEADAATSVAFLADTAGPLACFHLQDPLRADAHEFVDALRAHGREVDILSGDRQAVVELAGMALRADHFRGELKPQEKLEVVRRMQSAGHTVLMVGDGLNDAPVIAQADVSAAFATATTLAQTRADFVVLSSHFADLKAAMAIASKTRWIIRENLGWALVYNVVAIPVAAAGFVTPLWAGVGMAASSLVVVANALRLLPHWSHSKVS